MVLFSGDEDKLRNALKQLPAKYVNHMFPHPVSATVLHVATRNNSLDLVNLLLQAAADPNAKVSMYTRSGLEATFLFYLVFSHDHNIKGESSLSLVLDLGLF